MSEPDREAIEELRIFRETERAKMLAAMHELIEDAQKRAKSNNTLSRERAKWATVAGKLIWYKDQILRSMDYEALAKDVARLNQRMEAMGKERAAQTPRNLP